MFFGLGFAAFSLMCCFLFGLWVIRPKASPFALVALLALFLIYGKVCCLFGEATSLGRPVSNLQPGKTYEMQMGGIIGSDFIAILTEGGKRPVCFRTSQTIEHLDPAMKEGVFTVTERGKIIPATNKGKTSAPVIDPTRSTTSPPQKEHAQTLPNEEEIIIRYFEHDGFHVFRKGIRWKPTPMNKLPEGDAFGTIAQEEYDLHTYAIIVDEQGKYYLIDDSPSLFPSEFVLVNPEMGEVTMTPYQMNHYH